MKAAKAGCTAESEIPDDHTGVEAPAKKKLSGGHDVVLLGEAGAKDGVHHTLQPGGPVLQACLLLQRRFEALLQSCYRGHVASTHPAGLLLYLIIN